VLTLNPTLNVPSGIRSLKTIDLRYINANPDKIKAQAHAPPLTLPLQPPSPPLLPPLKQVSGLKRRPTGMEQRNKGTTTQKSQNADDMRFNGSLNDKGTRAKRSREPVAASRAKGTEKGRVDGSGERRADDQEKELARAEKDNTVSAPTGRPRADEQEKQLAKGRVKVASARTGPSAGTHRKDNTVSAPIGRPPLREATPPSRGPKREVKSEVRERGGRRGTRL
jgi:hypothetical protein